MSKIALLSDVHGNFSALKNVIQLLESERPDQWVCLGDIVGYGPFPGECIELIIEKEMMVVKGNHDAGVAGELSLKHFRNPNRRLVELTQKELSQDHIEWLKNLPYTIEGEDWIAVHACPENPERWEYVESAFRGRRLLNDLNQKFCFLGHTHRPAIISNQLGVNNIKKGYKYIVNPGSIGQSRDGDYRASCALIDTKNFEYKHYRVEFNQEENLSSLMKKGFLRKEAQQLLRL
ncbi:MAG: metallophosphoesterase family protein [Balneola sp.]|nr:metallophosphoesterase family protein [Balneola sp.]